MTDAVFLTVLATAAFAQTSPTPQVRVNVSSVVGMHTGKCVPSKVILVQHVIADLMPSRSSFARACKCGTATYDQLMEESRHAEHYLHPAQWDNLITIDLAEPITLPLPKGTKLSGYTRRLVAKITPQDKHTVLWIGHERKSGPTLFNAFELAGDPFHLSGPSGTACR